MSWKTGESGSIPSDGKYVPLYRPAQIVYGAHGFLFNENLDDTAQGNVIGACSEQLTPI